MISCKLQIANIKLFMKINKDLPNSTEEGNIINLELARSLIDQLQQDAKQAAQASMTKLEEFLEEFYTVEAQNTNFKIKHDVKLICN